MSLKDPIQFTALSYVCGDPKVTEDVLLLDHHVFLVTVNLAAALKHVKAHWCKTFPDRDPRIFRL